jgi:hypothetical protein
MPKRKTKNKNKTRRNVKPSRRRKIPRGKGLGNQQNTTQPSARTTIVTNRGVLREMRIQHREFVTDIDAPDGAGIFQKFEVNPGLEDFFPWLSAVAQRFESYYFHSFKLIYVPSVSTGTNGSIAICPDYDAADDNSLASKSELMSFEDSVRGSWWSNFTMTSTPRNLRKSRTYYIRGQALNPDLDVKMYDTLQVNLIKACDQEIAGAGELWVEYDIQLITPQKKHEAEPLQVKRTEGETQITNGGRTISDVIRNIMNVGITSASGGDELAVTTPGVYHVSLTSDSPAQDPLTSGGPLTIDDSVRASTLYAINSVLGAGSAKYATDMIWDVTEETDWPGAPSYLQFGNFNVGAGHSHDFIWSVSEVLPSSPFRVAVELARTTGSLPKGSNLKLIPPVRVKRGKDGVPLATKVPTRQPCKCHYD